MPLILGDNVINYINGPSAMIILKPKNPRDNTFILFGELHKIQYYSKCEYENCLELQTTFIEKLNEFAKYHPTDFFIESYFKYGDNSIMNMESITDESSVANKKQFDWLLTKSLRQYKANPTEENKSNYKTQRRRSTFSKLESNMTQLDILYRPCFFQKITSLENCPYKNIRWQYADSRSACEYNRSCGIKEKSFLQNIYYADRTLVIARTYFSKPVLNGWDLEQAFDDYDASISGFEQYVLLLKDTPLFVEELLTQQPFKKQYDKVNDIFTIESFVRLFNSYLQRYGINESKKQTIILLFELLTEWSNLHKIRRYKPKASKEYISSKQQLEELDKVIHNIFISSTQNQIPMEILREMLTSFFLDIYFILRSYDNNSKLTVGYFGIAHVLEIQEYFVNIIHTHTTEFSVNQDTSDGFVNTPIYIDKVIEIPEPPKSLPKSLTKSIKSKSKSKPRRHSNPSFRSLRSKTVRAKSI